MSRNRRFTCTCYFDFFVWNKKPKMHICCIYWGLRDYGFFSSICQREMRWCKPARLQKWALLNLKNKRFKETVEIQWEQLTAKCSDRLVITKYCWTLTPFCYCLSNMVDQCRPPQLAGVTEGTCYKGQWKFFKLSNPPYSYQSLIEHKDTSVKRKKCEMSVLTSYRDLHQRHSRTETC